MAKAGYGGPFHPFHHHPQLACLTFGLSKKGQNSEIWAEAEQLLGKGWVNIPSHSGLLKMIRGW